MMHLPNGWKQNDESLVLELKLADFKQAVELVNSIANIAEELNHHPDISIKNYNELTVTTTTHDSKNLTEKDYKLAQKITDLVKA